MNPTGVVLAFLLVAGAMMFNCLAGPDPAALPASQSVAQASAHEFKRVTYREVDGTALQLRVFSPSGVAPSEGRPGIIFFFGGGWSAWNPEQFYPFARHFAAKGCVVFCAEYRVGSRHKTTPHAAVADAHAALSFVRAHAAELGVASDRIAVGGGSSGGHLAACTALMTNQAAQPAALLLLGSVLDTSAAGFTGGLKPGSLADISPQPHIRAGLPPTLILHGTADQTVPFAQAKKFYSAMRDAGNVCELKAFKGRGHGMGFSTAPTSRLALMPLTTRPAFRQSSIFSCNKNFCPFCPRQTIIKFPLLCS